jgi:hypothetical protein
MLLKIFSLKCGLSYRTNPSLGTADSESLRSIDTLKVLSGEF